MQVKENTTHGGLFSRARKSQPKAVPLLRFMKQNGGRRENKIMDNLIENKDNAQRIQTATCAILLEMANCDEEFSDTEKNNIISILKKTFQLSDKSVNELIETSNKKRKESTDMWHFTHIINENYSIEDKIRVIETMWNVIYADGKLDKHEDYLVHKLSNLLRLTHKQLIDAKIKILHREEKI